MQKAASRTRAGEADRLGRTGPRRQTPSPLATNVTVARTRRQPQAGPGQEHRAHRWHRRPDHGHRPRHGRPGGAAARELAVLRLKGKAWGDARIRRAPRRPACAPLDGTLVGDLRPAKDKSTERINGTVALIMAIGPRPRRPGAAPALLPGVLDVNRGGADTGLHAMAREPSPTTRRKGTTTSVRGHEPAANMTFRGLPGPIKARRLSLRWPIGLQKPAGSKPAPAITHRRWVAIASLARCSSPATMASAISRCCLIVSRLGLLASEP